ncbi:desmethyl-deoxy-podophyllotoxin synthase-like [Mercurialis annua]|uniref:desmethyl-deoxy-podophyllotoxin synthase-like n=1 Tax=Mercurialis annua TaxID=3986 RepID=UPI002160B10E|nr:desmethyl-deoxy-podophyllotoxin synthase-like [Mercurialis annua]
MISQILSLPLPILFCLFFLILLVIWKKLKTSNSKLLNLPPGPRKFPIIGNIPQLIGGLPHHKRKELADKYGPVMHLQIGEVPTVVVSSAESAKQVLQTHDIIFANRPLILAADVMFYKAADIGFARYGESFKQLKKICMLELFSPNSVQLFRPIREQETSNLMRSVTAGAGSPINLTKMLHFLSCTIIVRAAFGDKCPMDREAFIPLAQDVLKAASGLCIADLFPSLKWLHGIAGFQYGLRNLHKKIDLVLEKIINEHRILRAQNNTDKNKNLVHVLLNYQEQGNLEHPLTIENIKAVILDLFIAGTDTSSITTEWVMSELIKNPKVMQKAQAEVRKVFDGKRNIDETMISELTYLKLVIKESLRLHPSVPLLVPRESSKHCEIGVYDIPAQTRVFVNTWALGRDPKYWFESEKFLPERFIDNPINFKGGNFEFLPFGSGRRICPGYLFGLASVELVLVHLLYYFDWELPDGEKKEDLDMAEEFGAVTTRKNNLYLIPIPCHEFPTD